MFDKDLFLSLCEKYDVELSDTAISPMIKYGEQLREIKDADVSRVFMPCQTYFSYSSNKINASSSFSAFYLQEVSAIAC